MRAIRRVAVVGALELRVAESLRELGCRTDAVQAGSVFAMARKLSALKPHVIHAREAHLKAALVARLLGVPAVLEVADEHLSSATAYAGRIARRVLFGSAAAREALVELGTPASSSVVLRGLTRIAPREAVFPPMLDAALRWVVCAAPCDGPDRGVSDALLAFASLARARPSIRLLVNATGVAARGLLAQAEAAGLRNRVVAHSIGLGQLQAIFAHAAAVLAPSRSGSRPDYLPEALAAGAAIIATAVGPHPTWLREGRTGFLVPSRAPVALSARLASLLDDSALATRIREEARKSAGDAASPRACALELSRCYAGISTPAPLMSGLFLQAPARVRLQAR